MARGQGTEKVGQPKRGVRGTEPTVPEEITPTLQVLRPRKRLVLSPEPSTWQLREISSPTSPRAAELPPAKHFTVPRLCWGCPLMLCTLHGACTSPVTALTNFSLLLSEKLR